MLEAVLRNLLCDAWRRVEPYVHAAAPLLLVLLMRHFGLGGLYLTSFTAGAIFIYGESLAGEVPSWGCVSLVLVAAGVGLEGLVA